MALTQRLELRTSQSLVMTPQLMQAIKLLQLSSLDLAAYVDAELERNPLLERAEAEENPAPKSDEPLPEPGEASEWLQQDLQTSPDEISEKLDSDLSNVFADDN